MTNTPGKRGWHLDFLIHISNDMLMTEKILTIGPLPDWVLSRFNPQYEMVTVEDSDRSEVLRACDESVIAIIARGAVNYRQ